MRLRGAIAVLCALVAAFAAAAAIKFPEVTPGKSLAFPADHGAHPDFRNEWWYVTGWLKRADGSPVGFQVTFFRFRPGLDEDNPSGFAAKQVLFAHAALSDPKVGKLLHQERVYRAGFGVAGAKIGDTDVALRDWRFIRSADGRFHAIVSGKEFALDLTLTPTAPVLPEGLNGYSQKGPQPAEASYYYSIPQISVAGQMSINGVAENVTGSAWLDREWSSNYLDRGASGWDWTGLNLADGGALMAFRIRNPLGNAIWAGGTLRDADGATHVLSPGDIEFVPLRKWRSPQSGAEYPVEMMLRVRLPAGVREWRIAPLFDNQEYDSRAAGGPLYWEGAVRANGAIGYLELTGYAQPLRM